MATGSDMDDQFSCPVHLDILVNPVVLQACQHWICKGCLQKYVSSKNGIDLECPECREPFDLPPGGVEAFRVNHRMRDICQTLLARQNSQSPEVTCGKHQGEPLSRFCCQCLEAVCEECGDEDHSGHRIRNIGSAWRFAAPAIEQIFEKSKIAARQIDESLEHSITRRVEIDKMKEAASNDVNDLRDKLCNHVTAQANGLIQEIERRFGEQDEKEERYFQNVSASLKKLQNINKYKEHLQKMLSSNSHVVTEADVEALTSLKAGEHLNNATNPTPRFSSYLFEPNPLMAKMLSESIGDVLTDKELKQREATKATANNDVLSRNPVASPLHFQPTSSKLFVTPSRPSSQLSVTPSRPPSGFLATPSIQPPLLSSVSFLGDDRDPPPTDEMIRVRSRIMLPHPIVNPVDVEPYLEDRFIISDKTGSVTLISSSAGSNEGRKVISLKPSTNSEILVQSGVVVTRDKRLFTCNGTQTCVEQYDLDSIACVRRIGDESRFTSPRCLTHGVTNRMLYVSDIKGGVKVFDSYNGQHVDEVGGGLLLTPSGLTTDNNSRLFVADELQGQVYIFDIRMNRAQQPLQKLSTEINGTLLHCHDVAVSGIGNIYVTVTRHLMSRAPVSLLLEYDGRGRCKRKGGWELRQPRGLRVAGRSATVVDETENCITTYML
ncbi:Tripartite motif-containing protein 2 [Holothuria leucospilota]|uniref:Tripartite motif-containing protein 2 n=1 Tax=Holothuria leucospilota TaxID=206669 RepID=A0A9Q1BXI9_HOLLE|nr:Tripartite motif-containing protein 2 [Holothuria leucospilota]